ncbi:MAG: hypothetical protein ACLP0B_08960 [Steroidobacteraceae bacterium]|jgi:hypothetical protein
MRPDGLLEQVKVESSVSLVALESEPAWRSFQAKSGQDYRCDRGINGIRGFLILCAAGKGRDSAMLALERTASAVIIAADIAPAFGQPRPVVAFKLPRQ